MAEFKTSDRNEQTSLDDAELATVVAGYFPPVGTIHLNTGWVFKDVFAKPTLGTYH
jgi:hypothetical protein